MINTGFARYQKGVFGKCLCWNRFFDFDHINVTEAWFLESTPQFHIDTPSSTHQFHTINTKNPSVPHQKSLASTHPPQFHTKNPSVPHIPQFNTKNPKKALKPENFQGYATKVMQVTRNLFMLTIYLCF